MPTQGENKGHHGAACFAAQAELLGVCRELLSGQASRFKETDENTAPIGTDGLDYGNHHGRERLREDLSGLPEEPCACCSWTILTPQKCWFKSRDPLPPPATPVAPHKTSHLWYSRGLVLSTGPDEMGFRRPPCAAC